MPDSQIFLLGAATTAAFAIALFFLRFWRATGDRFFAAFALAFAILGLNWISQATIHPSMETRHYFYMFRLAAFLLIIWAIVDKNRGSRRGSDGR